jgi:hypothetical protein
MRLSNFKRHANTSAHKAAHAAYMTHQAQRGGPTDGRAAPSLLAASPLTDEFAKVWREVRGCSAEGSRRQWPRKRRTLEWCLFEALRDRELTFLETATCISIALDERNGRLLLKYAAANRQLDVRSGCFALLRDAGATARDVASAVHQAVARFCTRRELHRGLNAGRNRPVPNLDTQEHIRQHIEMFTADGAANEQLAGRLLHPSSLRGGPGVDKLPNLRLVLRDKAHATRRITERTFKADPVLDHILQVVVLGEASVARLLKNSRRLQCLFEAEVAKQTRPGNAAGIQSDVRNMSFAKQRFDSTAKPLGRCMLNLEALTSTMDIICRGHQPATKEHRGAAAFLELLEERHVVLLGMMADASDEALLLTRFFDREAFRLEDMAEQLATFERKLEWLFAGKGCLGTGFTSLALAHLHTARLVPLPGGCPRAVGGRGASPAVITECVGRMVAWSRLAVEVARTEFPDFEVLAAFQAFRLTPPMAGTLVAGHLAKLALAFKFDGPSLLEQFLEHQRVAQAEAVQSPGDAAAAVWKRALQKTQATARRRHAFQAEALVGVLQRFLVSPGSTSGIRQNFSMFKRVLGQQWNGSPEAEERRLVLLLAAAASPAPDAELLAAARLIWARVFGAPRRGAPKLQRAPAPEQQPRSAQNAAAWLRRRRQDVAARTGSASGGQLVAGDAAVDAAAMAAWSAKHDGEVRRQKAVRAEHLKTTIQHGCAPTELLGPAGSQEMQAFRTAEEARERTLDARQRHQASRFQTAPAPDVRGCRVFVDEEAREVLNKTPAQWALARRQGEIILVEDRAVASIFVALNPSQPGDRTSCVAAMTGALVSTPELFLNPPGVALKFQRALSLPRHIYLSTGCSSRHNVMVALMWRVCELAPRGTCRWTWYLEDDGHDRGALFLARARRRQAGHLSEMVSLLLPDEIRGAARQPFPNRKTLKVFLAAICKVDARFTRLGLCGR